MSLNNRYASFLKRIMDYVLTKISIIDYLIIDYTLSSLLVFVFSENKNNLIILQKRLSSFFFILLRNYQSSSSRMKPKLSVL